MHIAGPIVLYLLAVVASAAALMPVCRLVFDDTRRVPLVSLSVTLGIPVSLLAFSLVARVVPPYSLAVPVTAGVLVVVWLLARRGERRAVDGPGRRDGAAAPWDWRTDAWLLGVYALVFLLLLWLRTRWPSLYWDNDYGHVGSEKLFNFTLLQAFVHGSGFPPENLWLAGQPIDYYVLIHALPGLAAWGWRVLGGDPLGGGVIFVFSDAFLLTLGSLALSAWSTALLMSGDARLPSRTAAFLGLTLGVGVLLSASGQAVGLVLRGLVTGTPAPWWMLEREAVLYTYSQYPFFLLLQGDHHAFQRIFFLQVALYGTMLLILQARTVQWPKVLLAAALASAVMLAHSGSVLLDVAVLGTACGAMIAIRARQRDAPRLRALIANLAATAAVTVLLSLPVLIQRGSPAIAWYWVDMASSSPFPRFLLAQSGPLAFLAAAFAAGIVASRAEGYRLGWPAGDRRALVAAALLLACLAVVRGGAAVAIGCALATIALAPHRSASGEDRTASIVLGSAVFVTWLLPEFLVGDFAYRQVVEWKRWNLAMRFWLEGYYLVPFMAVVAFGPALGPALRDPGYRRAAALAASVIAGLCVFTHAYSVLDRLDRTPSVTGLDGAAYLAKDYPCDAAIAADLARLQRPVRIGELCGTGEVVPGVPVEYGWAGRIAAFSGRPGVCGWSRHVWQFTPVLHGESFGGPFTWTRFRVYESALRDAYLASLHHGAAAGSRATLDALGVTDVVLGDQEARLFPGLTGTALARALGGNVQFQQSDACAVISLAGPAPR